MRRAFPWSTLGIDADSDEAAVRRAYAKKLKAMDPDADHKGFERLRAARDRALSLARARAERAAKGEAENNGHDDGFDDEAGESQWRAGSRDYDDEDLPVAYGDGDPTTPAPYGGIYVDVLRGDEQAEPVPVIAAGGDPALSIPPPVAGEEFRAVPPGLTLSPDSSAQDAKPVLVSFAAGPPVLGHSADPADTVTPAALTETVDGKLATSQDALYRLLLHADPDEPLTADDVALVHRHLDVILGEPRMEEVGFATDMENWLASIFSGSTPRSHPFVQRLADHFGWRTDAGTVSQPRNIAWLADRALAFDFRDKVTQPSNKGYRAWIELSTPGKKRHGTRYVRELLTTIRSKHPVLETELDWHKVSLWDGGSGNAGTGSSWGKNAGWIVIGFIGFVQIVGAIGRSDDSRIDVPNEDQAQSIAVQLAEFDDPARRRVTIDDVLRRVGGNDKDADWLQASKPQLLQALDSRLAGLKTARGALENAEPELETMLYRRIRGNLTTAPYSLLVSWRRAESAMLKEMADQMPGRCAQLVTRGALPASAAVLNATEAYQRHSAAMLIAGDSDEPEDASVGFEAWTVTFEDAARRADMPLDRWRQAYSGNRGQGREFCIVNASIIDAALAAPREESERVLRDL